jgi:outer membrane protein assembly factor BamB
MYRGMVNANPVIIVTSGKFTFAIEISTGMTRWAYALKHTPCRISVANDRVYIAGNTELACVDYGTGKVIFHVNTQLGPDLTLLVDGEQIYVGASGRVACYGQFGERLWTNDLGTTDGVGFAVPYMAQQVDLTSA